MTGHDDRARDEQPAPALEQPAVLVARCENYREDLDELCTGRIRFRWGQSQAACDTCGAYCGIAVAAWERVEPSQQPAPAGDDELRQSVCPEGTIGGRCEPVCARCGRDMAEYDERGRERDAARAEVAEAHAVRDRALMKHAEQYAEIERLRARNAAFKADWPTRLHTAADAVREQDPTGPTALHMSTWLHNLALEVAGLPDDWTEAIGRALLGEDR